MRTISFIATLFAIAAIQGCNNEKPADTTAAAVTAVQTPEGDRTEEHEKLIANFLKLDEKEQKAALTKYVKEQLKTEAGAKKLTNMKWEELKAKKGEDLDKIVTPIVAGLMEKFKPTKEEAGTSEEEATTTSTKGKGVTQV